MDCPRCPKCKRWFTLILVANGKIICAPEHGGCGAKFPVGDIQQLYADRAKARVERRPK